MATPWSWRTTSNSRSRPRRLAAHALPRRQEAGEGAGVDGLDLLAQGGQRPLAQLAQHLGVAPLPPGAAGPELAPQQQAGVGPRGQEGLDHAGGQPEPQRRLLGVERAVGAGEPPSSDPSGSSTGARKTSGRPGGGLHAEGVAVAAGVLGGDQAGLAGDAHLDGAAVGEQVRGEVAGRRGPAAPRR